MPDLLLHKFSLSLFFLIFSWLVYIPNSFAQSGLEPRPNLEQLKVNITEFKAPQDVRLSPFLAYDSQKNVMWTGDITSNSSNIIEFDLNSDKFVKHKLTGFDYATHMALDSKETLWYIDPIKNILGHYDPVNNSNKIYLIPHQESPSGLAIDKSDNVWILVPDSSEVLKFDSSIENFSSSLPVIFYPMSITSDESSGKIWVAEISGKIAVVDPVLNNITEYGTNQVSFTVPTSIVADPRTGKIYFSEHNDYTVSSFDPSSKTFKKYSLDFGGLPAGVVFDNYGNLWVSQHTLDKVAVIDVTTGQVRQFDLPQGSIVQWLEKDSNGDIAFADQNSNTLGIITTSLASVPEFPQLDIIVSAVGIFLAMKISNLPRMFSNGMQ